ncbi:MAG TPA: hypothetical protein PLZ15_10600 [Melioribacteraceae bacterium]|nr:hypothetical protein [Melioribacteraceae bacterium]
MIPEIRKEFNSRYSDEVYNNYLNEIWQWTNGEIDFRISETPLFLDNNLTDRLTEAADSILKILQTENFKRNSFNAVPEELYVPNEDEHPLFLQIDFAITKDPNGNLEPKLIELQGFPSLYSFQTEVDRLNRKYYKIPEGFNSYFNGLNEESYFKILKSAILGLHNPENVILLEIEPDKQKTRIDFYITGKKIGIKPVCISDIVKDGKNLYYTDRGKKVKIERIYNRVIFDELLRRNIKYNFDFRDQYDVEWAGHPNWFFKISKHSLPLIKGGYAPETFYLSSINEYPENLQNYVLKPLYSFAGSGVVVDLSKDLLEKIDNRENYILQKKVEYAPLIETPDQFSRAEIRMMYIWIDEPVLVNNLLRTSKGRMMGVDFNKGKTWVGSNIAYHT